ncbi:ABC-F family ATP-binding cassette domain-containing protein [Aquibacillus koreensis]|uniref:ABC-F family ATP-binding cassette domain-containing protein n=1 Tax=Aquibacillus koreensis TaxID=279446 RepID=A0A9X3WKN9_9BACI|nr:ABC-F family ATP-binding cassette domain-containing protein [Aquibacillus koreensis]MCT2536697.1 ABC-F family ATP-binding cassette domain-containing protein [Aquibacillus koreensis]MDC3421547.1 ABC-F family ATP-binding cassette domain-containing protein [Aquibacillus koreensis]
MILMQINNLVKRFGAELILSNIKVEIQTNDRIAIVGRNGAGKSTLLKIMAGHISYDEGQIYQPKDTTLGYLAQNTGLESSRTIWGEMLEVFRHLVDQEKEIRMMEQKMGDPTVLADQVTYEQLLEKYDAKQQAFKTEGGFHYEADIKAVLNGLHFQNHDLDTPISELSGGQKTRLALGKLLLSKPDLLILDEPTNHLDIETLTWLEGYLNNYKGAVVIVSHDRYFLDKTVNIVYEISRNQSTKFHGNYSKYLEQKAANYERDMKQFEKQQTEIKKLEEFVQKNIVRASTTKRAQSRRKQLEKMDKLDKPSGDEASAKFSFDIERRSGNDVLKIKDLAFRYDDDDRYIFSNLNFDLTRGESIALVGPNGVGKTTLLKTIIGSLKASKGTIQIGTNVQIGYYDQEQANLNSNKTVLMELWDDYPMMNEKDIRTILGNFLFSGDDVLKPVYALSGGEKARLSLAKLMMEKSNLLILDEPTNHLDLDSKEILEAAMMDFPGSILFVSHDRYFINKITSQIVEMQGDSTTLYLGDYDYYLEKKQEELELEELNASKEKVVEAANDTKSSFEQDKAMKKEQRKRERRIKEIEEEIEKIEIEMEEIEALLCEPDVYQDHEKSLELTTKNEQNNKRMESLMEEWEELHE